MGGMAVFAPVGVWMNRVTDWGRDDVNPWETGANPPLAITNR